MKPKILIADDEAIVRDFISEVLIRMGHAPLAADSGEKAIKHLERTDFDVVITDFKMPGLSGIDVLKKALELWPDCRVIIITAFGTIEHAVRLHRICGCCRRRQQQLYVLAEFG